MEGPRFSGSPRMRLLAPTAARTANFSLSHACPWARMGSPNLLAGINLAFLLRVIHDGQDSAEPGKPYWRGSAGGPTGGARVSGYLVGASPMPAGGSGAGRNGAGFRRSHTESATVTALRHATPGPHRMEPANRGAVFHSQSMCPSAQTITAHRVALVFVTWPWSRHHAATCSHYGPDWRPCHADYLQVRRQR